MTGSRDVAPLTSSSLAALAALTFAACGGSVTEDSGPCALRLAPAVLSHACSHASNGTPLEVTTDGASVSSVHRAYRVDSRVKKLTYRPRGAGRFALLTEFEVGVRITTTDGAPIVGEIASEVNGCPALKYGVVFSLPRTADYQVIVEAREATPREYLLFIERVDNFGSEAVVTSCSAGP